MTLDDFLARLQGVKAQKSGHMANCPAHDDAKASLSVRVMRDDKDRRVIRIKCFTSCTKDAVLDAMQLTWRDLYIDEAPESEPGQRGGKRRTLEWVPEAEYDYTDEGGDLEFQVIRLRPADGAMDKKIFQRRPVPGHPGEWAYGLSRGWYVRGRDDQWRPHRDHNGGAGEPPGDEFAVYLEEQRPLIYRLGAMMDGSLWKPWPGIDGFKGRWCFVVEGEKKADALLAAGFPATTNAQGAGKWRDDHTKQLKLVGVKRVLLSPDNDAPGFRHMTDVARSCWAQNIATLCVPPPLDTPKSDLADYLALEECAECRTGTTASST